MNLENIYKFAQSTLTDDTTGHDWRHALRVERNAKKIAPPDLSKADVEIIRVASWLHDTIDDKVAAAKRKTPAAIKQVLQESEATPFQIEEVLTIIQNLSYSKNLESKQVLSPLGQIVQDADRLDALGAIGIARAFYYGGHKGNPLYDNEKPRPQRDLTEKNYRQDTSVINHFFEKLLLLEQTMNTEAGTAEAVKRTKYMRKYLEQFFHEISSE